jgi:hypothetical protein
MDYQFSNCSLIISAAKALSSVSLTLSLQSFDILMPSQGVNFTSLALEKSSQTFLRSFKKLKYFIIYLKYVII